MEDINLKPNKVYVFVGNKGAGKTTAILDISDLRKSKRLIYSYAQDARFDSIQQVHPLKLHLIKKSGLYFLNISEETKKFKLRGDHVDYCLGAIRDLYFDGAIILDDTTHIVRHQRKDSVLWLLNNTRHSEHDIFLSFHALNQVPNFIWDMADYLFLFQTTTFPKSESLKNLAKYEEIVGLYETIQANKEPYKFGFMEL